MLDTMLLAKVHIGQVELVRSYSPLPECRLMEHSDRYLLVLRISRFLRVTSPTTPFFSKKICSPQKQLPLPPIFSFTDVIFFFPNTPTSTIGFTVLLLSLVLTLPPSSLTILLPVPEPESAHTHMNHVVSRLQTAHLSTRLRLLTSSLKEQLRLPPSRLLASFTPPLTSNLNVIIIPYKPASSPPINSFDYSKFTLSMSAPSPSIVDSFTLYSPPQENNPIHPEEETKTMSV